MRTTSIRLINSWQPIVEFSMWDFFLVGKRGIMWCAKMKSKKIIIHAAMSAFCAPLIHSVTVPLGLCLFAARSLSHSLSLCVSVSLSVGLFLLFLFLFSCAHHNRRTFEMLTTGSGCSKQHTPQNRHILRLLSHISLHKQIRVHATHDFIDKFYAHYNWERARQWHGPKQHSHYSFIFAYARTYFAFSFCLDNFSLSFFPMPILSIIIWPNVNIFLNKLQNDCWQFKMQKRSSISSASAHE